MRYLIYGGTGIGDLIINLPMARRIRLNDPSAHISLLACSSKNRFQLTKSLLSMQEYIDEVYYYSVKEPIHSLKMLAKLGIKGYDYAFKSSYTDNKFISEWPNRIINIVSKKTVGIRLKNKPNLRYDYEFDFCSKDNVYLSTLKLLALIGIGEVENEKSYPLLKESMLKDSFKSFNFCKDRELISIVIGTADVPVTADGKNGTKPAKHWPYEYWSELSIRLVEQGYNVVILGGPKEEREITGTGFFKSDNIINICGKLSIIESMSVISNSVLTIGCDTGLLHCSAALNIPSLTIYGCTSYLNYLPYGNNVHYIQSRESCSPCFGSEKIMTCYDYHCMKNINVDVVYNKVRAILKNYEN